jgi:hypothetical protein
MAVIGFLVVISIKIYVSAKRIKLLIKRKFQSFEFSIKTLKHQIIIVIVKYIIILLLFAFIEGLHIIISIVFINKYDK